MYLTNFEIYILNIWSRYRAIFSVPGLVWQAALKKAKVKLNLLSDINMLLMEEKSTRGVECHPIHRYVQLTKIYERLW